MSDEIEKTGDGEKVGSVSASRYAEIVAELLKLVETASRIQCQRSSRGSGPRTG